MRESIGYAPYMFLNSECGFFKWFLYIDYYIIEREESLQDFRMYINVFISLQGIIGIIEKDKRVIITVVIFHAIYMQPKNDTTDVLYHKRRRRR